MQMMGVGVFGFGLVVNVVLEFELCLLLIVQQVGILKCYDVVQQVVQKVCVVWDVIVLIDSVVLIDLKVIGGFVLQDLGCEFLFVWGYLCWCIVYVNGVCWDVFYVLSVQEDMEVMCQQMQCNVDMSKLF